MRINLCEIIDMPGSAKPFSCRLETDRLGTSSISEFIVPPQGEGVISNTAGILTLSGRLTARASCFCDRCGESYEHEFDLPLEATLSAEAQDEDNPDVFLLEGNELDLSDVLETLFILDMDTSFLCRADCAGLCSRCGKNLNEGPCSCEKEIDPRLAVLRQLLDKGLD
ncbi:MAG: DUF177 domain-containing protein [Oscillospiraceae bacterium]|jgi:uncharacterized protein|nr:DUF177 domain-containing protein [Oscillospiraceae bacterium]